MPIKNLTLGLSLLMTSTALAHNETYRIHQGDTLSGIAKKFHSRPGAILSYNGLKAGKPLKVGRVIDIPTSSSSSDHKKTASVPSKSQKVATKSAKAAYKVQHGENDWIIAHHFGMTTPQLKAANPGIDLSKLHPGQTIHVPGYKVASSGSSKSSSSSSSVPRLHSRFATIKGDAVTIRRAASRSSEAITQVDSGTYVMVLNRDSDWYLLRFPHGTEGWVRGDFLQSAAAPQRTARVSRHHHEAPQHVAAKPQHHETRVAARSYKKKHVSDTHYSERLVAFEKASKGKADGSQILASANSFRGVRYRWGAMSRSGTDCSGFTSQVFRSQGYHLPRTSREQSTVGIPVHSGDLKAGDLVFFHTMRGSRVTHVGIYMGNGKFIHASSGGGKVQVNSLSDGYYKKRLVAARRVAKSGSKSAKKAAVAHHDPKPEASSTEQVSTLPTESEPPTVSTEGGDSRP